MTKVFFGHVDKDGVVLLDSVGLKKYLESLRGDIQVIAGKRKRQRSLDQNSLYWLWLGIIEGETGNDKNALHDFFKSKFLKRTKEVFGKTYEVVESSALQDTIDFMEFMKKVNRIL